MSSFRVSAISFSQILAFLNFILAKFFKMSKFDNSSENNASVRFEENIRPIHINLPDGAKLLSTNSVEYHVKEERNRIMSTYNHSSSYNRTYERKVIEEGGGSPSVRIQSTCTGSPLHTIKNTLGGIFTGASSSFINPHNYHFGTTTSGSFQSSDESLSVTLDVSAFTPEDLKVSVVGNQIVVEGKHAEKPDDIGLIERHFIRKFALPRNAHPDSVTSNLSADGQLSITAHSPKAKENSPARTIPIKIITSTGPNLSNEGTTTTSTQPQNQN